jgi:acetyl-CoA synthetase
LENILPPANPRANLQDYRETCDSFRWEDMKSEFSWSHTGKVNIAYEAIDRHAEDLVLGQRCCLNFEAEGRREKITYHRMRELSNKFANVLRKCGVRKGDRVFFFLPRCPEYYIGMVGCAKVGAIFGPLFEALMQETLRERLGDSEASILVTTPRLATRVPFAGLPNLRHLIFVGAGNIALKENEWSWEEEMVLASAQCDIEWVDLEHPLYLIYAFSSSGQPKGVVHVHNDMIGYLMTARWVLDLKADDILWTTADPGWVTGTVYSAFAPWLCGVEVFVRGGSYNTESWCRSIESNRITVLYTAPTFFRRLKSKGDEFLKRFDLSSIRHLLSVGEPLPSEVVYWAKRVFKVPVHDTWWMTETGMIMIANYPSVPIKPGAIGKPLPGIKAAVIDFQGEELPPLTLGELAIQKGWPAMLRQIWRDGDRLKEYFPLDPWFVTGDTAYMDDDGYFYYQGRNDDLVKVAGVVVGPTEMEDALRRHPAVRDAGIIAKHDPLKGNSIKAFISLKPGVPPSDDLKREITDFVKKTFSPRIAPGEIEFRPEIPRSKEGLVIRRVLKAWELGLPV